MIFGIVVVHQEETTGGGGAAAAAAPSSSSSSSMFSGSYKISVPKRQCNIAGFIGGISVVVGCLLTVAASRRDTVGGWITASSSSSSEADRKLQLSEWDWMDFDITDDFPIDLQNALCPGLKEFTLGEVGTRAACRAKCKETPGCDLWQWCKEGNGLCGYFEAGTNKFLRTLGGNPVTGSRCYITTKDSPRTPCRPDGDASWTGGTWNQARMPWMRKEPTPFKRGFSGHVAIDDWNGNTIRTCGDNEALGQDDSWYYNWQIDTSSGNFCRRRGDWGAGYNGPKASDNVLGAEFIPLIAGVGVADLVLRDIAFYKSEWERANVNFLMGFNEPDPRHNHPNSVHAYEAAVEWLKVQQIADMFDPPLVLVAPSPARKNYELNPPGISTWMEYFMGNCSRVVVGCDVNRIKYMNLHDYTGDFELFKATINGLYTRYGRPVWITEYAIGDWRNSPQRPQMNAYMQKTVPWLEASPAVHRYVWHTSRVAPERWNGFGDLIVWNQTEPQLTSTGQIWSSFPKSRIYD